MSQDNPFSAGCVYRKQHCLSFPKRRARQASTPGETFHIHLYYKTSTPTLNAAYYFMLLKNDYSKYSFCCDTAINLDDHWVYRN